MVFEGCEKRLELQFQQRGGATMRAHSVSAWIDVVAAAGAVVLSHTQEVQFDAYVLSESSLFVYDGCVVLITCGQTRVFDAIARVLDLARECKMVLSTLWYSHCDFAFPQLQPPEHQTTHNEREALLRMFPDSFYSVVGAQQQRQLHAFTCARLPRTDRPLLAIYMQGIPEHVCAHYTQSSPMASGADMARQAGLDACMAAYGRRVDAHAFSPCGLSVNGVMHEGGGHWAVHVTPENSNTYVSFEAVAGRSWHQSLMRALLSLFRPDAACVVTSGVLAPQTIHVPHYTNTGVDCGVLLDDLPVSLRNYARRSQSPARACDQITRASTEALGTPSKNTHH